MGEIRVLQVVTHMNRGGLETMLMNYYRKIDRSVIQFDFLTHRPYDGDYGEEIKNLGGKIYHLPVLNPFSRKYLDELEIFFKIHPYQIVHSHLDCMSAFPLSKAQEAGIKVLIAHAHNTNQDKNIKYLIKSFAKRKISNFATNLLACGQEAGKWMFGNYDFQIMHNAIEASSFKYDASVRYILRKKYGLNDQFVIGHVGRFNLQKNHSFLIDVFYELLKKEPHAKLLLVGGGDGENKIKEKVHQLGIDQNVIFAGVCSNVNELLQAMDVFVFPSIYEGLPVTLIEAQAAGLPCVVSQNVPEESSITDLVYRIGLEEEISKWVNQILCLKKKERKDYSETIQESGYDIETNAKWLTNFYLQLLEESKR